MLSLNSKVKTLNQILNEKPANYADSFKEDILRFFDPFDPKNDMFNFLNGLNKKSEIRNWVNRLTSRIVMHEDDELISELISDYYLNG